MIIKITVSGPPGCFPASSAWKTKEFDVSTRAAALAEFRNAPYLPMGLSAKINSGALPGDAFRELVSLGFPLFEHLHGHSFATQLERVTGIEPAQPAWKAGTLPLSYTRSIELHPRRYAGAPPTDTASPGGSKPWPPARVKGQGGKTLPNGQYAPQPTRPPANKPPYSAPRAWRRTTPHPPAPPNRA